MTGNLSLKGLFCPRLRDRRGVRTGILRSRSLRGKRTPVWINALLAVAGALVFPLTCVPAEGPFIITYTHQMEEPGNLEFGTKNVVGKPEGGNRFVGTAVEFEYGVKGWWTSELYLDGQATGSQSAIFTGYRSEHRFRLLPH